MTAPNLTPPATKTKSDNLVKPPKLNGDAAPEKKAKVKKEAAPVDPNAPKKERAPRQDYGYAKDAIIRVAEGDQKLRGQRGEWLDRLRASNGQTVQHFIDGNQGVTNKKGNPEPPRGWLRSFVQTGVCTLEGGSKAEAKPEAVTAEAPTTSVQ